MFRARKKRTTPDLGFVGEIVASEYTLARRHMEPGGCAGHFLAWRSASMASTTTSMRTRWPQPARSASEADALVFLTRVPGVRGANGEVMRWLSVDQIASLTREEVISGGMLPKCWSAWPAGRALQLGRGSNGCAFCPRMRRRYYPTCARRGYFKELR